MTYKVKLRHMNERANYILILFLIFISIKTYAQESYEGIIGTIDTEPITTYDLNQRIMILLKSINLEDNMKNRDLVRKKTIERLVDEKIKSMDAKNAMKIPIQFRFNVGSVTHGNDLFVSTCCRFIICGFCEIYHRPIPKTAFNAHDCSKALLFPISKILKTRIT